MLPRQCPKCGTPDDGQFIGSFCKKCFILYNKTYAINEFEVDECAKCGDVREGKTWSPNTNEILKKMVQKSIKTNYETTTRCKIEKDAKGFTATVDIQLDIEGHTIKAEEKMRIPTNRTQCPNCSMKAGGYHEAIIQLRGKQAEKLAEYITREIEKTSYISKTIEQKTGYDLQIGSKKAALQAVTQTNKPFTTSNKLVTEKDGKKLFRTTILVRT